MGNLWNKIKAWSLRVGLRMNSEPVKHFSLYAKLATRSSFLNPEIRKWNRNNLKMLTRISRLLEPSESKDAGQWVKKNWFWENWNFSLGGVPEITDTGEICFPFCFCFCLSGWVKTNKQANKQTILEFPESNLFVWRAGRIFKGKV